MALGNPRTAGARPCPGLWSALPAVLAAGTLSQLIGAFEAITRVLARVGVPLGVIPVALILAYALYATSRYLRGRAEQGVPVESTTPFGRARRIDVPVERGRPAPSYPEPGPGQVPPGAAGLLRPPPGAGPAPGADRPFAGTPRDAVSVSARPNRVRVYSANAIYELPDEWVPPTVSVPPPKKLGFGWRMTAAFVGSVLVLIALSRWLFFGYISNGAFVPGLYDDGVNALGAVLFWPLTYPGVHLAPNGTRYVPDFIFMMYLAVMLGFGFASGLFFDETRYTKLQRRFALAILLAYTLVEMLADTVFFTVPGGFYESLFLLVRGFIGGFFFSLLLFTAFVFPIPLRMESRFPRDRRAFWTLLWTGTISLVLAGFLLYDLWYYLGLGRTAIPFAVLLLLPVFALTIWGFVGRIVYDHQVGLRPVPPVTVYHPPVSIIIPAYNEETNIAATIAAADRAAALYPGPVEILVSNDGSTDRTFTFARAAIGRLQHAAGAVVDLPHGGKSNALNGALRVARGEIIIRCDADTRLSGQLGFAELIPHFADPDVGGVQGLILPLQSRGWTRKLRFMEIAWNHLFLRRALMATRTTQVVDGAFCAFRRRDLLAVGGWVSWNGEDTEITLRLERFGYNMRFETRTGAFEDVPPNYAALKKQRVRWNRGGFFAHRRHFGAIFSDSVEYGGIAMLFWFLLFIRGGLRSLIYVYAILVTVLLGIPTFYHLLIIVGLLLLPRAIVIGYYLVRLRRWGYLPWLPIWPVAGAIKQFFTMEAFGTMLPGASPEFAE